MVSADIRDLYGSLSIRLNQQIALRRAIPWKLEVIEVKSASRMTSQGVYRMTTRDDAFNTWLGTNYVQHINSGDIPCCQTSTTTQSCWHISPYCKMSDIYHHSILLELLPILLLLQVVNHIPPLNPAGTYYHTATTARCQTSTTSHSCWHISPCCYHCKLSGIYHHSIMLVLLPILLLL